MQNRSRVKGDRRYRRRALVASFAAVTGLLVAACGGGNSTKPTETTEKSTTESTSASNTGDSTVANGGADFIKNTFAKDTAHLGGGLKIEIGAAMLLSTSQAYYGQEALKGMELAAAEIKAAGGPEFTFTTKDLAVSTTAGADGAREWGEKGKIHMALAAGFFGTGSMIPLIDQYKILTIDPGGGTSTVFQGKPYAWGGRAITPDDSLAGVVEYLKTAMPAAKRWAITGYDIGDLTKGTIAVLKALATSAGAEIVGQALVPLPSAGTADYPKAIDQLRSMKPDVIFNWVWGSDPAAFMKAYALSGMTAPVIGPDFGATTVDVAGSAFDGYMFAYDYFDAVNPQNPWAKHFVDAFRTKHGTDPDYYPANYYEDVYIFWEIVQRTLAAGGDVTNGADLQKAMLENLTFPSVYGTGDVTGSIAFDATSHSLAFRPMGLFVLKDGKPQPLAYFNIGGKDFKLP
ncbi:MAG: ABC transporter substrate-binding protein [Actinomycetota bacterium]